MKRPSRGHEFRSILCPVDFSEQSASALRHAAALRRWSAGSLTALFVVDPLLSAAAATAYDEHVLERTSCEELKQFVATTLGRIAAGDVRCVAALGRPANEIRAVAKRTNADVIVLGTHGLSGVPKLFFGSTTDALLRTSDVPLLAIPAATTGPQRGWPGRLIMAAVDLDDDPASGIATAKTVARFFHAALFLVHVVPELRAPHWVRANQHAFNRERVADARIKLAQLSGRAGGDVRVETRALLGDPGGAIAALASNRRADLLLLKLPRLHGLLRPRSGATVYRILCASPVPLLAFPAAFRRRIEERTSSHRSVEGSPKPPPGHALNRGA